MSRSPTAAATATGATCGRMRASSAASAPPMQRCRDVPPPEAARVSHRASYWKTTLSAFGGAAAGTLAIRVLILWHLPALIQDLMLVPPVLLLAASLLVAAGGIVCLWRDARNASGRED